MLNKETVKIYTIQIRKCRRIKNSGDPCVWNQLVQDNIGCRKCHTNMNMNEDKEAWCEWFMSRGIGLC